MDVFMDNIFYIKVVDGHLFHKDQQIEQAPLTFTH